MDKNLLDSLVFKYHPHNLPGHLKDNKEALTNQENVVQRKSVKLLTYNLYMRPPPVKTNASDHKDARLLDFVRKLEDFDIVCN